MLNDTDSTKIIEILEQGKIEMEGLIPWGSNYTFLVHVSHRNNDIDAVYKPSKGERPLWDFARGSLSLRERAAYLVSSAIGWRLVPPTVLREGPHGMGSLQYFVDHDPDQHYLTFQGSYNDEEQKVALFDFLINNADRKSGHVLIGDDGRLWAIDHGVSFHKDYKLRSVVWSFSGLRISERLMADLVAFQSWLCYENDSVYDELTQLLDPFELEALKRRLDHLIEGRVFPHPGPGRHYPWPLV